MQTFGVDDVTDLLNGLEDAVNGIADFNGTVLTEALTANVNELTATIVGYGDGSVTDF